MYDYLIVCRTLTYAQRTQRALSARGWRAVVIRTPPKVWREGCGWSVRVSRAAPEQLIAALEEAMLAPKRIFRLENGVPKEEVPL